MFFFCIYIHLHSYLNLQLCLNTIQGLSLKAHNPARTNKPMMSSTLHLHLISTSALCYLSSLIVFLWKPAMLRSNIEFPYKYTPLVLSIFFYCINWCCWWALGVLTSKSYKVLTSVGLNVCQESLFFKPPLSSGSWPFKECIVFVVPMSFFAFVVVVVVAVSACLHVSRMSDFASAECEEQLLSRGHIAEKVPHANHLTKKWKRETKGMEERNLAAVFFVSLLQTYTFVSDIVLPVKFI